MLRKEAAETLEGAKIEEERWQEAKKELKQAKCRKVAERLGKEGTETRMSTKRNRLINWKR